MLFRSGEAREPGVLHRVGPVDPSLRALSRRLTFTVRLHTFNQDSLSWSVWLGLSLDYRPFSGHGSFTNPLICEYPSIASGTEPDLGSKTPGPAAPLYASGFVLEVF